MDSLTQIILGAATGEVVLGKKIGNRAMVWGAVGGTIPDLDVLGKFFLSSIDNLAFHRGISHSILFSVLGAIVIGWLVYKIYQSEQHKWIASTFKVLAALLVIPALDFVFRRLFSGNFLPIIVAATTIIAFVAWNIRSSYFKGDWEKPSATLRDWQWLFFWSLLTHPILDCFTTYGTQLFAPFMDTRVAWGTISVADPLYTLPFLICLLIASRITRTKSSRRYWNYLGIGVSSLYMLFTVFNKQHINKVFANSLSEQNIPYERFIANPTILNNILWTCTAETKEHFYLGQYSLFDEVPIRFSRLEKKHELLKNIDTDRTIKTLRWFSDEYFAVTPLGDQVQFSDLRFGTFSGKGDAPDDFVFKFILTDKGEQGYLMEEAMGGPPPGKEDELMSDLFERIQGIKK